MQKLAYDLTHIQGHKRQPVTQHLYKTVSNVTALSVRYYNSFRKNNKDDNNINDNKYQQILLGLLML